MKDNSIVNMEIPDNHVLIINDSTYKRLEKLAEKGYWGNVLEANPSQLINYLIDVHEETIIVRVEDEVFRLFPFEIEVVADDDQKKSKKIAEKLKNLNEWEIVEDIKETLHEAIEEIQKIERLENEK